jgi:hypothetical protein
VTTTGRAYALVRVAIEVKPVTFAAEPPIRLCGVGAGDVVVEQVICAASSVGAASGARSFVVVSVIK